MSVKVTVDNGHDAPVPVGMLTDWDILQGSRGVLMSSTAATDVHGVAVQRLRALPGVEHNKIVVRVSCAQSDDIVVFLLTASTATSLPNTSVPASWYAILVSAVLGFALLMLGCLCMEFRAHRKKLIIEAESTNEL